MNDVEHDMPEPVQIDFPPLLNWDEVMRDECEDPLGFARRTTHALLTLFEAGLLAGFSGGNQKDWKRPGGRWRCSRHLRRQMWFAEAAEKRLGRVAEALAAAG